MSNSTIKAEALMRTVRTLWVMGNDKRAKYFATLAMKLALVSAPEFDTAATDGDSIFYNPDFIVGLSESEVEFLWAHEVMHCCLGHHLRRAGRDLRLWNIACDLVINPLLEDAGFTVIEGALMPGVGSYADLPRGLSAEAYYSLLSEREAEAEKSKAERGESGSDGDPTSGGDESKASDDTDDTSSDDDGDSAESGDGNGDGDANDDGNGSGTDDGDGSGSGSGNGDTDSDGTTSDADSGAGNGDGSGGSSTTSHKPKDTGNGRTGGVIDAPAGKSAESEAKWRRATVEASNHAGSGMVGSGLGDLDMEVKAANEPVIDWHDVLAEYASEISNGEESWNRFHRRLAGRGIYLPSDRVDALGDVVVLVDTSGSTVNICGEFLAEITEILRVYDLSLTVFYHDTAVRHSQEWDPKVDAEFVAEPKGGGGTKHVPAFAKLAEADVDPTLVIAFTDLETRDLGRCIEPDCPVLWCKHGNSPYAATPPFGRVIEVN